MNSFTAWMDSVDKAAFAALRGMWKSDFMEANAGILGDLYAWVPMLVFLAIVLYLSRPGSAVFSLFFGLAAFILSFQAAMILANVLQQPSPVAMEYMHTGALLPAYGRALGLGMPDWAVAALAAVFHFSRLRIRRLSGLDIAWGWIALLIFCLLRVYAGYTYPMGALMAALVGVLVAWLMFQLCKSVELLTPSLPNEQQGGERDGNEQP